MRLTKNDMSRVVIQALYNLPVLPATDDPRVVKLSKRSTEVVKLQYDVAYRMLIGRC